MFDNKFLLTLIGVFIAAFALCSFTPKMVEGFAGLDSPMTWKVSREVASSKTAALKGDMWSVPGTYQSLLNPRFSNVNYGANIKYNMPSYNNQAVPVNPLKYGSMAQENYEGDTSVPSCGKGGAGQSSGGISNYANGNYNEVLDSTYESSKYPDTTSLIPVGDMTTVNALGETIQPIVYDRYIYANRNSRLRSQGDPIRGDLPIIPRDSDWFRPSVHPNIDLQEGAMNVMGGEQNQTANALASLIYTSSGGGSTTIGGVNMANQFSESLSAGGRDVQVTAFH